MKPCSAVLVSDKAVLGKGAKAWKHRVSPVLHVIGGLYLMKYCNQKRLWITPETLDSSVATLK